jgi:hypothetical protein
LIVVNVADRILLCDISDSWFRSGKSERVSSVIQWQAKGCTTGDRLPSGSGTLFFAIAFRSDLGLNYFPVQWLQEDFFLVPKLPFLEA